MRFINVGFGNMVAAERITILASPDSAPMKIQKIFLFIVVAQIL